ncbi:3'-5' DNA helicase [Coniothyrium glycines]
MADSEDYDDDDFGDTEFLEVATQAEKENTPAFHASPRPAKRRKISHANQRLISIPGSGRLSSRRGPFLSSSDDDHSQKSDQVLSHASNSPQHQNEVPQRPLASRRAGAQTRRKDASHDGNEDVSPVKETMAQKREARIHVPTTHLDMTDMFFTQPPQEQSPPWKPRGAIWTKTTASKKEGVPLAPAGPAGINPTRTMTLPGRQSVSSRPQAPPSPHKSDASSEYGDVSNLPINVADPDYDFNQDLADLPSDAFASSSSSPQKQDGDVPGTASRKRIVAPQVGLRQTTLFGRAGMNSQIPASQVNKRYNFIADQKKEPPAHHKLDAEAIKTWVYPTNLGTIRDYQFNIVQRGLFHNLLVALPTGLGKTFIAATVMLNWYRWTSDAQIVFVAPTKPLVAQQIEACFKIAGIPRSATTMLTGGVATGLRAEEWKHRRVFFMTPQTLLNDLKAGYADPKKIVLLVVDEAHRATGAYAYVEVVSFLRRFNESFRVLALTATPGADVEAVQKVIDGLDISKVEIRTENSMDICQYVHSRTIAKQVFNISDEMQMCMDLYSEALQPLVTKIQGLNAYWSADPCTLTPYGCNQARSKWAAEAGRNANQAVKSMVNAVFTILASISHGMDLLKFHGIGPFYTKMKAFEDEGSKSKSKYRRQVLDSESWKKLMIRLRGWISDDNFVGHPKLEYLQQVILDHFVNAGDDGKSSGAQTRIMVFAHFRDSAEEIARILKRHDPMIRPRVFVGQSHGKNSEGMSQKEQLEVIEKFKSGVFNTLIATSIGEEGLDIGEVDLIICYDSKASPIRMLQRMGRTGRKRQGKIVMLQMSGKEENDANKAKDSYEKMQELIAGGSHFTFHDEVSRRILPPDVRPTVDRREVDIPLENTQHDWLPEPKKGRRTKKPPKKFHMPDNVITGFVTAGHMGEEIVPKGRSSKVAASVYPSELLHEIPAWESVILDAAATEDLERKYQTVFDDDDAPIVGALDLNRHFECQRALSHTSLLPGHGRTTRAFVKTMQRMHTMDNVRLDLYRQSLHYSDCESDVDHHALLSDTKTAQEIPDQAWADDDPASQTLAKPKPKTKTAVNSGPKTKAAVKAKSTAKPPGQTIIKKPDHIKAQAAPKTPGPRGRPRKEKPVAVTPISRDDADCVTPRTKTPNWRVSGLAHEGAESSPPPTDPRFRVASQADTIGSDDTIGDEELQDTQAYLMDSELASFIVEDEEDVEVPTSSLPSVGLSGLGRGTQAVVEAARPRRPPKREKIFTSDPTDDDAVVSSDSDDEGSIVKGAGANKRSALVVDSATEEEEDEPVLPRQRVRRVIDDDDDDDDE